MKYIFTGVLFLFILSTISSAQSIKREDLVFKSGNRVLSAKMIYPESTNPIPFLVFVGGEEAYESFGKDYRDFLQENFEDVFLLEDIGFFYINTRGIGSSEGRWQRADIYDRAIDVKAGLDFLKNRQEVDIKRIGVFGHGRGAWIAQVVASQNTDDIAALLSLAGPTFDMKTTLTNGFHARYVCNGRDSTAAYKRAVRQTRSVQGWVNAIPWTKRWRQGKVNKDFDPTEALKTVQAPSLFLFAEHDREIYPSWATDRLNEIFDGNIPSHFTVDTIPLTTHDFRVGPVCYSGNGNGFVFSDVFKSKMRSWVLENL